MDKRRPAKSEHASSSLARTSKLVGSLQSFGHSIAATAAGISTFSSALESAFSEAAQKQMSNFVHLQQAKCYPKNWYLIKL